MANIIVNPGFEEPNPINITKPFGWQLSQYTYGEVPPYTGLFPLWATDQIHTGLKSVKFDLTSIDPNAILRGGVIYSNKINIDPTVSYKIGVFIKGENIQSPNALADFQEPYLRISEYNLAGTYIKFTQWNLDIGTYNWKYVENIFKPRTDTVDIRVETTHTWNQGILWVDDYKLSTCSTPGCLISHWNMNESSGTIVNDIVSYNTGISYNTVIVPGVKGNALQFNGTNAFVSMGSPPSLDFDTSDFTISTFVKTNSILQKNIVEKRLGSPAINPGFAIVINAAGILRVSIQDGINKVVTATDTTLPPLNNNIWHPVAVVFDRTNGLIKKYIDGIHVGTDDYISNVTGSIDTTQSFEVGRYYGNGNSTYFNGTLDEIKIWNRTLSSLEISDESIIDCVQPTCSFSII